MVVVSYQIVAGPTNDIVKLWVNPTTGTTEAAATLTLSGTNTLTDLANLNRILIRQGLATDTPSVEMDELRIGTTWESVTPSSSPAVISSSGAPTAITTVYGSTSASPTSFDVSGTGIVGGILVTAPAGYFVSLSSGSGYGSSVSVPGTGTILSTPVYVSLSTTATVAGSPHSGNIVLSSSGATPVNVATVPSTVSTKALTITGIYANSKVFDGNTNATIGGTPALVGVVNGDIVNIGGSPIATFNSSAVGTGIGVTVTGYAISGGGSGNYTLTQPSLTADITNTPPPVINSALTATASYGTSAPTYAITATQTPTSYNATGLPAGLSLNTSTGAITGIPTVMPGPYNVIISATNSAGTGNATLVYTIAQKNLTVSGAVADNKVYNRTTTATISGSTLVGVFGSDVVTISNTGIFASEFVANGIVVTSTQILGGTDEAKYTVTLPIGLTANITQKAVTIGSATAVNKVYDGNTTATITGTLVGVISPDVVSLTLSGTFASSAIASGIAVTSTSTISGADVANYSLTQPTGLTANITDTTIYVNQFTGISACPTPGNVPSLATNATGAPLSRNTITCTVAANVFNSTTLNNTASPSPTSYIEFSATATAGYVLNVKSMSFFRQASGTAPNQIEVRYSTDGFASSTLWSSTPVSPTSGTAITWDFTDFTTPTAGTVTFRIYPYGTQRADLTASAASGSGTFRLDDVTIYGSVTPANTVVNLKLYIEGYYDAVNHQMVPAKANQAVSGATNEVTTLTVELLNQHSLAVEHTTTAELKQDGTAVCTFATAPSGTFFLKVTTWNTVQTYSKMPVPVGSTPYTYNFSNAATKAAGDNQKFLETGVYGIYSGNFTIGGIQDPNIDNSDYSIWEADYNDGNFNYIPTDLNGDANPDNADYSIWEGNYNDGIYEILPDPIP